jgi:glycosyltransferase involved in cell wall biosynthesis
MQKRKCRIFDAYPSKDADCEGGLRTQGIYKTDIEGYPLVTYITVVYNRVDTIMKCMQSVWNQDYPNIEYIIIDGASTDGTLELIEDNSDKIDYYISQSDTGIYNAMNKGVTLARGRLICFMNSDDECMPHAASRAVEIYKEKKADVICGSRELAQHGKRLFEMKYPRYAIRKSVFRYVQMFHQSTYVVPETFDVVGYFQEEYTLLADWIWESKTIDAGFKVYFSDEELARFSYDGASCKGMYKRDYEWERWVKDTYPAITDDDGKFLLYCLDRGRHPLFDLKVINKVAFKYFDDDDFRVTYCATVLDACIEQSIDIKYMQGSVDELIAKLDRELKKLCDLKDYTNATREYMESLVETKRYLNKEFYRLYLHKKQLQDSSKLDRLLRVMCFTVSRFVSRSKLCSSKFYVALRFVWYHMFNGKFVENQ